MLLEELWGDMSAGDDWVVELGASEGKALFVEDEGEAGTELLVEDAAAEKLDNGGNDGGKLDEDDRAALRGEVDVQSQSEVVTVTVAGTIVTYIVWASTS